MWLTPSSTARRSTATGCRRSPGARSPEGSPVSRIAPNPRRLTARSPSRQVPAASAAGKGELTRTGYPRETGAPHGILPPRNAVGVPFPADAVSPEHGRRLRGSGWRAAKRDAFRGGRGGSEGRELGDQLV